VNALDDVPTCVLRALCLQKLSAASSPALPPPAVTTSTFFDGLGRVPTPVYMLDDLVGGQQLSGPALLIDNIRWGLSGGAAPAALPQPFEKNDEFHP